MQGTPRPRRVWGRGAACLALTLTIPQAPLETITVGRVTVIYRRGDDGPAMMLGELADRPQRFPGLAEPMAGSLRLVLAPTPAHFDSLTGGRVPDWGMGAAVPAQRLVVLNLRQPTGQFRDLRQLLRHELAHLAVREASAAPLPRWFDEGYAVLAAGEWGRSRAIRVNLRVIRGRLPTLLDVERALLARRSDASTGYALAGTAVMLLNRWGGSGGLGALLTALAEEASFDAALRRSYGVTAEQFERLWQRDLRRRYGWMAAAAATGLFWVPTALLLLALALWRRHRQRHRRAALQNDDDVGQLLDEP